MTCARSPPPCSRDLRRSRWWGRSTTPTASRPRSAELRARSLGRPRRRVIEQDAAPAFEEERLSRARWAGRVGGDDQPRVPDDAAAAASGHVARETPTAVGRVVGAQRPGIDDGQVPYLLDHLGDAAAAGQPRPERAVAEAEVAGEGLPQGLHGQLA